MKYFWLVLIILFPLNAFALTKQSVDLLTKPTLLLSQGRYAQSADSFHRQSNLILSQERKLGTENMWKSAGLAAGLAAISAEKNKNAIAYEYWANSVRYFLLGGTTWESYQKEIRYEFEQANTRLQVSMQQSDSGATLDEAWLQKLSIIEVWEDKLGFFSFRSPALGLSSASVKAQIIETQVESPQYQKYNPQSKLSISPSYTANPTFIAKPDNSVQESTVLSSKGDVVEPLEEKSTQVVIIATPIEEPIATIDELEAKEVEPKIAEGEVPENKQIHRGNLEAGSTQGVSAVQRRSFAPEAP
ncbi:hypothetical protein EK599_08755 [Vibrio sp. T187]|uniref:hypothetical protein n=1 Tax=Vibrio TaxID=662 RepID=UPI0010C965E3|nr:MULTISPECIES: hypothetical protein [Vibrio]MBW3695783.1 hypothetical protein [Vibrio sp. T187]